jgi:hypothetical protein
MERSSSVRGWNTKRGGVEGRGRGRRSIVERKRKTILMVSCARGLNTVTLFFINNRVLGL